MFKYRSVNEICEQCCKYETACIYTFFFSFERNYTSSTALCILEHMCESSPKVISINTSLYFCQVAQLVGYVSEPHSG